MQDSSNNSPVYETNETSITDLFFRYLKHWKLFIIIIFSCLFIAFIYLRYVTREYAVVSTVVINDDKKGQAGYDLAAFSDLGIITQGGNVDNEIEVLRSKSLMQSVVDSLDIDVAYFVKGWIKSTEIYNETPVRIKINEFIQPGSFVISKTGANELLLKSEEFNFEKKVRAGEMFESPCGWLTASLDSAGTAEFPILVYIYGPDYDPGISINSISKTSSVVGLSIISSCPAKDIDVINTLVDIYNKRVIEDKNSVANSTIRFIDERLIDISGELKSAEKDVESYKQSRKLTDPQAEANLYLNTNSEYTKKIAEIDIQISILKYIRDYLKEPENKNSVVPSNIGLTDPTIINLINTYNTEILEIIRTTSGMLPDNPQLKETEKRTTNLRTSLLKGIEVAENGLKITRTGLDRQENMYSGKIKDLPTQEREARELTRQKDIKETLVIYLLQKREETGLTLTMTTPNAKVIDRAYASKFPVKPKSKIVLLAALLLGIIFPIIYIYVKDLLNYKISSKEELTHIVKAPFLGEIPVSKDPNPLPVSKPRSEISEKFRTVASNLQFIIGHEEHKVIVVTSTVSGEGKSFFSRNLALSIATTGKKTLLIDLDIRKSIMNQTLSLTPNKGIVMYLSDPEISVDEIIDINKKLHKNLDIIPTKIFPPNPAELLASDRLDDLFKELRPLYDYIVIDTAPVGLVSDVYQINKFADVCVYVTRMNYTHKKILEDVQSLYKDNKLHNMTCVLNGTMNGKLYGYGYGYGKNYYHES